MSFSAYIKYFQLALLLFLSINVFGQDNSYTVGTEELFKHGLNSDGATVAAENTDSVTSSGVTRYWYFPDTSINPGYDVYNPLTTALTNTFTWDIIPGTGTANGVIAAVGADTHLNYRQVTWSGVGVDTLSIYESTVTCNGDSVKIPVAVINAPTLRYTAAGGVWGTCASGADGTIDVVADSFNVVFTSAVLGNRQMKLKYDITCTNVGFAPVANQEVNINETTNRFALAAHLHYYGVYTITLKTVTDRIAVKSGVEAAATVNTTFTINIYPTPASGTVNHRPNQ
jgi:hypothetical protein